MGKPKPKPKKRSARAMEEMSPTICTLQPSDFKVAVARVEEAQCSVEESRAVCGVWERQLQSLKERIMELDKECEETRRQLADAQGLLQAKEAKLHRELEVLRYTSYSVESAKATWNCDKASLASGAMVQCEKAAKHY